jgi:peptide-methionine (S)-S-oxide reductase
MSRFLATILAWACLSMGSAMAAKEKQEVAIFAGGCFWCMEQAFDSLKGVTDVVSGYAGGTMSSPTYEHHGDHAEAIRIVFNPDVISYNQLLNNFWHNVDPLDAGGQFCDRGLSYRSEIFYLTDKQHELAKASNAKTQKQFDQPIVTKISKLNAYGFTPAEEYHQDYHIKNPLRYKFYKWNCGRQQRLDKLWR